jgi:ParB-like chromosome segregation protein Spo0J
MLHCLPLIPYFGGANFYFYRLQTFGLQPTFAFQTKPLNMEIVHIELYKLLPYAGNVMEHSEAQVADIATAIVDYGFNNPVLVSDDGTIIAGHGRVLAAKKLGLEKVPCIVLAHLSEAQQRAYAIADNKIARKSKFNLEKLTKELEELANLEINIDGLGFDSSELDALLERTEDFLPETPVVWQPPTAPAQQPTYELPEQEGSDGRREPTVIEGELSVVERKEIVTLKLSLEDAKAFRKAFSLCGKKTHEDMIMSLVNQLLSESSTITL